MLDRMAEQFRLSAETIATIADAAVAAGSDDAQSLASRLWQSCRAVSRPQLDLFAQRIEPRASWDDLVLPEAQMAVLRMLVSQAQNRMTVYEHWGFARRGRRGLGLSALFAGPSGTGKTLAAEVLANELELDLYRIDLSAVVSKYIGETEKNLKNVFDSAEQGGVVLLFDEAEALFGKRSEVRDSRDRYANIEVGYLLQRMESFQGVAILTTNVKATLDKAFQRRLRFTVEFPYPGAGGARGDLAACDSARDAGARIGSGTISAVEHARREHSQHRVERCVSGGGRRPAAEYGATAGSCEARG